MDAVMANANSTPPNARRNLNAGLQPRRDFGPVDVPSYLEQLKATPSRHVTGQSFLLEQDLDLVPVEEPRRPNTGSRPGSMASSDAAFASEQGSGIGEDLLGHVNTSSRLLFSVI